MDEHRRTREMIIKSRYNSQSDDAVEITAEIEMLNVPKSQEPKLRFSIHNHIVQSLTYHAMSYRYEDIVEAHDKTFECAFRQTTPGQLQWSNLSHWLTMGNGVYWVNGKAGSGKSTLMKHIFDNELTKRYLRVWAKDDPLCVATFFFWNSGTKDQRPYTGMFRALLFQILEQFRTSFQLFYQRFGQWPILTPLQGLRYPYSRFNPWSLPQLKEAFKIFVRQKELPLKTCLLIDGLDEFDGDFDDIISSFNDIAQSTSVKVCLSSRPWPVLTEAFHDCCSLRLQDLTVNDIKKFVTDKFHGNKSFQKLEQQEPNAASALIEETVEKADGVFLWV